MIETTSTLSFFTTSKETTTRKCDKNTKTPRTHLRPAFFYVRVWRLDYGNGLIPTRAAH